MTPSAAVDTRPAGRIAFWDNAKFVMIVLMVAGHFIEGFTQTSAAAGSLFLFIYAFHMPVLIFISGLMYRDREPWRTALYYLLCGFVLKMALSLANWAAGQGAGFELLADGSLPWYLFALAAYQGLMRALRPVRRGFLMVFWILLVCFVGFDPAVGDFLYLSRILVFFPFYLAGTMLDASLTAAFFRTHRRWLVPLGALVLAGWAAACLWRYDLLGNLRYLFTGRNPYWPEIVAFGPAARLACYALSALTGGAALALVPAARVPVWTAAGARTLNVYFWHRIVYLAALSLPGAAAALPALSTGGKLGLLLAGAALSVLLASVPVFDYPLKWVKRFALVPRTTEKER